MHGSGSRTGGSVKVYLLRCPAAVVLLTALLVGCAGEGGDESPSGGGDEAGGSGRCPLSGDHTFEVDLAGAAEEAMESGDRVEWSLRVGPGEVSSGVAPGESVVVNLRFGEGELVVGRSGRALYVSALFDGAGTTFAQAEVPAEVGWTGERDSGERDLGPWQSSLSTNAGGAPIRVWLGAIGVNPDADDSYGCIALRGTIPASAHRVDDSQPLAVTASGDLTLDEVRVSLSGDAPAEPFALDVR